MLMLFGWVEITRKSVKDVGGKNFENSFFIVHFFVYSKVQSVQSLGATRHKGLR